MSVRIALVVLGVAALLGACLLFLLRGSDPGIGDRAGDPQTQRARPILDGAPPTDLPPEVDPGPPVEPLPTATNTERARPGSPTPATSPDLPRPGQSPAPRAPVASTFAAETRDAEWAERYERRLGNAVETVGKRDGARVARIECRSSICRVAVDGTVAADVVTLVAQLRRERSFVAGSESVSMAPESEARTSEHSLAVYVRYSR